MVLFRKPTCMSRERSKQTSLLRLSTPSHNSNPTKMLGFISKKLLKRNINNIAKLLKSNPFSSSSALADLTNTLSDAKGDAFTAKYLVNSCGVSVAAANRMSTKLQTMKSTDKPERVLKFFRSRGFDDTQVAKIVRRQPALLLADPEKSLKPKFDIFTSVGASNDTVVKIISKCPGILTRSVKNGLVPMFELLKSSMGSDEEALNFLAKYGSLWLASVNTLGANLAVLREMRMPHSAIGKFIKSNAYALMAAPERFKSMADRALEMGFDMEKFNFGDAIRAFIAITEENWKKKAESFRKWGWSDEDFVSAFKKQPKIMLVSEKKIEGIMSFLVEKIGVEAAAVARLPYVLLYSLENRIIPRCSLVQILVSKSLVEKKDCNFLYCLMISEEQFLDLYLKKHQDIITELMDVYPVKATGKATSNAN